MSLYDDFDKKLSGLEKKLADLTRHVASELSNRPDASAFARLEKAFQDLSKDFDSRVKYYDPTNAIGRLEKTCSQLKVEVAATNDALSAAKSQLANYINKVNGLEKQIKDSQKAPLTCDNCAADLDPELGEGITTTKGNWCDETCLEEWLEDSP